MFISLLQVILGALFHDIGHLLGQEQNLPRMETHGAILGIQGHENLGAQFLKDHGLPEITYLMVKGHVDAKRYLVYKDQEYHDGKCKDVDVVGGTDRREDSGKQRLVL